VNAILVINAGSSSIKFQLFAIAGQNRVERLLKGRMEGIGVKPKLIAKGVEPAMTVNAAFPAEEVPDVAQAMRRVGVWLRESVRGEPVAVGHRVVHGGPEFHLPTAVNDDILHKLEQLVPLAPLHQPNNLAPIRALRMQMPDLLQVACFDTAFHRGHPDVADRYAIPGHLHEAGVRRYGFHGLSYEYIAGRLGEIDAGLAGGRVIVAHLGSGASMCAMVEGRSVDSTMGFTALDGLPMGTRPGQIDPGVVLYLLAQSGMKPADVQRLLYNDCGLKGLSGISNDMRELLSSHRPEAALAVDYFVYRSALAAGALAAAMEGVDGLVFTAGIGENAPEIRARISARLGWLGAELDPKSNERGGPLISRPSSRMALYVIETDEELMIARHTLAVLLSAGELKKEGLRDERSGRRRI
jgi:acetate kinase